MRLNYASIARSRARRKQPTTLHRCSLRAGLLVATFSALFAGCGATPPITQQVDVPVFAPCVKAVPARPAYEFDKLQATASDGEKVLALARDWPRGRKYEGELEAVVAGCL